MSDSCVLPDFDTEQAGAIARRLFALDGPLKPLHGERDLNYLVRSDTGKFVFKIANAEENRDMLDCQHRAFEILAAKQVFPLVACARPSLDGREIETVEDGKGQRHYCRVLPFLEGRVWSEFEISSPALLGHLGSRLAALDKALDGFSHPGLSRPLLWNMEVTGTDLARYKPLLAKEDLQLVEHFERGYRERVLPMAARLRRAVIHNDANRENVLVNDDGSEVICVIDFGDMLHTWLVLEPAIAATYSMHGQPDPLASAAALVGGFHRELALDDSEIALLFDLVCMRLCMSVSICAYQQTLQPDNDYLSIDLQDSRDLLQQLQPVSAADAEAVFRSACGL